MEDDNQVITSRAFVQLQKTLNPEQFTIFRTASKNYRETCDCRTYISALSKLFLPANDTRMLSLFRGKINLNIGTRTLTQNVQR